MKPCDCLESILKYSPFLKCLLSLFCCSEGGIVQWEGPWSQEFCVTFSAGNDINLTIKIIPECITFTVRQDKLDLQAISPEYGTFAVVNLPGGAISWIFLPATCPEGVACAVQVFWEV
jgi:hypothetical protein